MNRPVRTEFGVSGHRGNDAMSIQCDAQRIRTPQDTQWLYCLAIGGSDSEEWGALSSGFRIVEKQTSDLRNRGQPVITRKHGNDTALRRNTIRMEGHKSCKPSRSLLYACIQASGPRGSAPGFESRRRLAGMKKRQDSKVESLLPFPTLSQASILSQVKPGGPLSAGSRLCSTARLPARAGAAQIPSLCSDPNQPTKRDK